MDEFYDELCNSVKEWEMNMGCAKGKENKAYCSGAYRVATDLRDLYEKTHDGFCPNCGGRHGEE